MSSHSVLLGDHWVRLRHLWHLLLPLGVVQGLQLYQGLLDRRGQSIVGTHVCAELCGIVQFTLHDEEVLALPY